MKKITVTDFEKKITQEKVVVIDVRSEKEYSEIHIKNSINVPMDEFEGIIDMIIQSKKQIVLVCQSGARSKQACKKINVDKGNIFYLDSGLEDMSTVKYMVRANATWGIERQVRLVAGSLIFISSILSFIVSWFLIIPFLVGAGLMFAAISNNCMMGNILMKLPYNRTKSFSKDKVREVL